MLPGSRDEQGNKASRSKNYKGRFSARQDLFLLCLSVFFVLISGYPAWTQSNRTLRIYLARHGETDWNAERRIQGEIDTALNAMGWKQAAVLAEIVKEVYTIEIVPQLGNAAANRLKKLGYKNVQVKVGDGYYGWKEHGPYDAIVVTAAAEFVPPPLLEQLKDGGKMIIPIGSPFMTQMLMLVEKKGKRATTKSLLPVVFVPFTRAKK